MKSRRVSIPLERSTAANPTSWPPGSSRNEYVRRLAAKGYITKSGDQVTVTDAGKAAAGTMEALPTGHELFQWWKTQLPAGEAELLGAIHNTSAVGADADYLEQRTTFKRSSRNEYLRRLKTRGLIYKRGAEWLAVDQLFG
jgi:hypothetical protein